MLGVFVLLIGAPWGAIASADDGSGTPDPSTTVTTSSTSTSMDSTSTTSMPTTTSTAVTTTDPAHPTTTRAATSTSTTVAGHTDASGAVADPSMLWAEDHAIVFSTQRVTNGVATVNLPIRTSTDLSHWTDAGDALPMLPAWATIGGTWAPSAVQMADGTYRLYFAARSVAGPECIGVATSTSPLGPYSSTSSQPLECQTSMGGSIDPSVYVDQGGSLWLLWKNDGNATGQGVWLWSSRLAPDGRSLAGPSAALLTTSAYWQQGVIENPDLVSIDGTLYLFYSGGTWSDASYGTGFATCAGPAGPCTNRTSAGPLDPGVDAVGNGSLSTFPLIDGRTGIAWSAWADGDAAGGGSRTLFIGHIRIGGYGPELVAGLAADPPPRVASTAVPTTVPATTGATSVVPQTAGAQVERARPHPSVSRTSRPPLAAPLLGGLLVTGAAAGLVQLQRRRGTGAVVPATSVSS
jgi:Glycosyl hydrolases family 43